MARGQMYWIDQKGGIIEYGGRHIEAIVKYPTKFGMTKSQLEDVFKKHNEPLGFEGKAREEIIKKVVQKGFIRVRYQRNYVSATVGQWTRTVKTILKQWASEEIKNPKVDKYQPVKIFSVRDDKLRNYDLKDLSSGEHVFESDENIQIRYLESWDDFGFFSICSFRDFS